MHELAPVDILQVIGRGVACDIEEMLVTVPDFLLMLSVRVITGITNWPYLLSVKEEDPNGGCEHKSQQRRRMRRIY